MSEVRQADVSEHALKDGVRVFPNPTNQMSVRGTF